MADSGSDSDREREALVAENTRLREQVDCMRLRAQTALGVVNSLRSTFRREEAYQRKMRNLDKAAVYHIVTLWLNSLGDRVSDISH